jgi:hypothetical protein
MFLYDFFCRKVCMKNCTSDRNANKNGISIRSTIFFLKSEVFGFTLRLSKSER